MYVSVGPPAFTALSFALLAEQSLRHFPADKTPPGGATEIVGGVSLYYIGLVISLMFWGLSLWFFLISTFSNLAALGQMDIGVQQLQMFALIFPNGKSLLYRFWIVGTQFLTFFNQLGLHWLPLISPSCLVTRKLLRSRQRYSISLSLAFGVLL